MRLKKSDYPQLLMFHADTPILCAKKNIHHFPMLFLIEARDLSPKRKPPPHPDEDPVKWATVTQPRVSFERTKSSNLLIQPTATPQVSQESLIDQPDPNAHRSIETRNGVVRKASEANRRAAAACLKKRRIRHGIALCLARWAANCFCSQACCFWPQQHR